MSDDSNVASWEMAKRRRTEKKLSEATGVSIRIRDELPEDEIIDAAPISVRLARYPDGARRVQGCYFDDLSGLPIWRDLPCIDVDENGQEIPNG